MILYFNTSALEWFLKNRSDNRVNKFWKGSIFNESDNPGRRDGNPAC
jgi:hypothetical protein